MSKCEKVKQATTYKPVWKGPLEGYVVNYITRNLWRVAATQERDDLMNEAYLIFMRCCERYPDMDTPQHFMALFKRCWSNHFTDLANADTQVRGHEVPMLAPRDDEGSQIRVLEPLGELENAGVLACVVRQAPNEVLLVLQLFLSAPQELVELALSGWEAHSSRKNQGSARINKLLGFPPSYDSVGAVREYFATAH